VKKETVGAKKGGGASSGRGGKGEKKGRWEGETIAKKSFLLPSKPEEEKIVFEGQTWGSGKGGGDKGVKPMGGNP